MIRTMTGILGALLLHVAGPAEGRSPPERGVLNLEAPSWGVTDWIQLPEGTLSLDVSDFKGIDQLKDQETSP